MQTVLGPVDATALGATDYHEHLFQASPLLPGEDLDDEAASTAEAAALRASGFATMVDATPTGLGRDPAGLARISAATGLRVVATTGAHRVEHYGEDHWLLDETAEALADRFCADVTDGLPARDGPDAPVPAQPPSGPVRAGVVKAGLGYWRAGPFERRVLTAVGATWRRTGVAVMVHLEQGSAAFEVLELLADEGVPADAVCLAHADRNPDPGLHAELAAAGAYLGYDGWARTQRWPDSVLLDCLLTTAEAGGADRLLLGGDVARASRYRAYGGMPGLAYLGERVLPRLERAAPAGFVQRVTVANPARWLTPHHPSESL